MTAGVKGPLADTLPMFKSKAPVFLQVEACREESGKEMQERERSADVLVNDVTVTWRFTFLEAVVIEFS